jgi:hypothetical protein
MFRLLAALSLAVLAGCGNSTREVSYGAPPPTNEVGVSKVYQLVPWKSRCVGGTCGTFKKESDEVVSTAIPPIGTNTASTPSMPHSVSSTSTAPAEIVPTEPVKVSETTTTESISGGSKVTTTTTTTRVIRRPRAMQ